MLAEEWAKARQEFLTQGTPQLLQDLKASGQLQEHLTMVGRQAAEMEQFLTQQMMQQEELPLQDYPEKVQSLESIPAMVEEMVMADLILVMP